MSTAHYVARELVINSILVAGVLAYLPRAVRTRKNRTFAVTVLVVALFGLCVNLAGDTIAGWQEGFHIGR